MSTRFSVDRTLTAGLCGISRPGGAERAGTPPTDVAAFITWIACAPPDFVLPEAIVTPLLETAWP